MRGAWKLDYRHQRDAKLTLQCDGFCGKVNCRFGGRDTAILLCEESREQLDAKLVELKDVQS